MSTSPPGYESLRDDLAWADLGHRTTVVARGPDAIRFVDNFTTAAIAPLAVGAGTETFFTDGRGWVIAMAVVLRIEDGLLIDAEPGLGARLRDHLEHYHIREQVELIDASVERAAMLVGGSASTAWLAEHHIPPRPALFEHCETVLGNTAVRVVRTDWWGEPGWIVQCSQEDHAGLMAWLGEQGLPQADAAAVEALRVEQGTPHPVDIREKTLPQELCRDARAISFTKGCYLGQETVARLDALGHVNRRFMAVAVAGDASIGAEVFGGDTSLGMLTSVCSSPRHGCRLGLGILSTRAIDTVSLSVDGRAARIVELPA